MSKVGTKNKIKQIVKQYAEELKKNKFDFQSVYLFGSHLQNKATKWSDIDVAVISDRLKRNWDKNENLLWKFRLNVDSRIEPLGFTVKDFQNDCDPMAYEIRRTGIRVA